MWFYRECRAMYRIYFLWESLSLFFNCIYLSLALLGLHCCAGFSLVTASDDFSLIVVCGLLIVMASLIVEHKL